MKYWLAMPLVVATFGVQAGHMTVTLDDILLLSQRGVSDETILVFLQNREIGFTPNAADIDKLLLAGVSEEVTRYLILQTATKPAYAYPPVTTAYADPYPASYYTPYYDDYTSFYSGSSSFFGLAAFPYPYYGYGYYGGTHHDRADHTRPSHFGNRDHRASDGRHGGTHGATRTGGTDRGHGSADTDHNSRRAGHAVAGGGHGRTSSLGFGRRDGRHERSGGLGFSSRGAGHGRTSSLSDSGHGTGFRASGLSDSGHGAGLSRASGHRSRGIARSRSRGTGHSGGGRSRSGGFGHRGGGGHGGGHGGGGHGGGGHGGGH
jgi:hypothetical protein